MDRLARILLFFFCCTLVPGILWASSGEVPSPVPLNKLVQEALANNPDLQAAEARWHLYERKVVPARSLADPQLSLAFMNYPVDTLSANDTPMTGNDLRLSQKFPFPGKLAAKGELAEQQALWFRGAYEDTKLQLVRRVRDAYYRLYYQDRAIGITEKNLQILDDFIRLTETRYEVGKGLQQDVLKAQVERSRLMDRLFTLKQQRASVLADLNTLLNRSSSTPVGSPDALEMIPVEISLEALQEGSENHRPLYAAYRSLIDRFKVQRELAKLDYRPDFNVWAGYRFREDSGMDPVDGTDFVSAGVNINLPIYLAKRREAVAEADAAIRMAYQQYDDFRSKVHFNIHDTYVRMEKDRDLVLLYKTGIIPQANQSFQATMAAYQVDRVDFLSLLDALLKLYRYEMDYYRVLADYRRDVARLEAESGAILSGGPSAADHAEPGQ